jgi:hypothetical protein
MIQDPGAKNTLTLATGNDLNALFDYVTMHCTVQYSVSTQKELTTSYIVHAVSVEHQM